MRGLTIGAALLAALAVVGGAKASAQALAGAQQEQVTRAEARFRAAMTYQQFTAADTARRLEWTSNYDVAATPVAEVAPRVHSLAGRWHLLIVAESWCGDAVNSVPYLARLAAENPNIELRLLRKADASDVLDAHAQHGESATPLVLIYDDGFVERGVWVERPAPLRALISAKEGRLCEDELKSIVGKWRAADGGRTVLAEVLALMQRGAGSTPVQANPTTSR